jgi:myo-inositol 2-dehydrogenase / D-chiro-inositol 1-dehydrogenase
MEKADTKTGWSFPVFEEAFNQGYRHELKHFIDNSSPYDCVVGKESSNTTIKNHRAVILPSTFSFLPPADASHKGV